MVMSASSGLKVAARLSPPLSMRMTSSAGKRRRSLGDAREVDAGVLADRGVRAAAGLDAHDPLRRQRAGAGEEFGVFLGVDVVGDRGDVVAVAEASCRARPSARSCRCRPGRRCRRATGRSIGCHERNSLVYWVSCRIAAISERKHAPPRSSSVALARLVGDGEDRRLERREHGRPADWPSGTSRTAAEIRFAAKACR